MNALYIGSFDPFTNGHYEVLKQAEELFDKIIICIAVNPLKERHFDRLYVAKAIEKVTKNKVIWSGSLITDLMDTYKTPYLIRGLRNTSDYLYEEQLIRQYKMLMSEIKVLYFRTDNDISSTFLYELYKRKIDIQPYLPYDKKYLELEYYMEKGFDE